MDLEIVILSEVSQRQIPHDITYMCNLKKHKNELIYESERRTFLVAQTVKRLPTMWETWVQSLGREDLLEKEMVTHSSILARKIPWMEKPSRLQSMGWQRVGHD